MEEYNFVILLHLDDTHDYAQELSNRVGYPREAIYTGTKQDCEMYANAYNCTD